MVKVEDQKHAYALASIIINEDATLNDTIHIINYKNSYDQFARKVKVVNAMINGWLILNILSTEIFKMKTALIVFAGSGAGGVLRYFIQKFFVDAGFVQFSCRHFCCKYCRLFFNWFV